MLKSNFNVFSFLYKSKYFTLSFNITIYHKKTKRIINILTISYTFNSSAFACVRDEIWYCNCIYFHTTRMFIAWLDVHYCHLIGWVADFLIIYPIHESRFSTSYHVYISFLELFTIFFFQRKIISFLKTFRFFHIRLLKKLLWKVKVPNFTD